MSKKCRRHNVAAKAESLQHGRTSWTPAQQHCILRQFTGFIYMTFCWEKKLQLLTDLQQRGMHNLWPTGYNHVDWQCMYVCMYESICNAPLLQPKQPRGQTEKMCLQTDWLGIGFTSHWTQNSSFRRRSSLPISWLNTEETKPNTTKARNTKTKWSKLTWKNTNVKT